MGLFRYTYTYVVIAYFKNIDQESLLVTSSYGLKYMVGLILLLFIYVLIAFLCRFMVRTDKGIPGLVRIGKIHKSWFGQKTAGQRRVPIRHRWIISQTVSRLRCQDTYIFLIALSLQWKSPPLWKFSFYMHHKFALCTIFCTYILQNSKFFSHVDESKDLKAATVSERSSSPLVGYF